MFDKVYYVEVIVLIGVWSHQCAESYGSFFLDSRHEADGERSELSLRVSDLSLDSAQVLIEAG